MSETPEIVWICSHLGDCGRYYPEAVEAEGEHGGFAVEYIRADLARAQVAAAYERAAQAAYQWWDDDDGQELRDHIRSLAQEGGE